MGLKKIKKSKDPQLIEGPEERKFKTRFKQMVKNGLQNFHVSWSEDVYSGKVKLTTEEAYKALNDFQDAVDRSSTEFKFNDNRRFL